MTRIDEIVAGLGVTEGLFLGGRWTVGEKGTYPVDDPATGTQLASVADGGVADAVLAVDAAAEAFPGWAAVSPRTRSEILTRVRELIIRDRDDLAELIIAENGKSMADAAGEVAYSAEFFRWFAEEAVRPHGDFGVVPAGGARTIVTHRPVGVAALVTPWNFPLGMAARKIAPALAAGCAAVLKPALETPLSAIALARLLAEAGVPAGVANVVPGQDASAIVSAWLDDPRVRKISFTGSTRVGRLLMGHAADRLVNASMELGGAAPYIVTADADVAAAVDDAVVAKFRNSGQACIAANCVFVHADVADEFTERLGKRVAALRVGPAGTGSDIGPMISRRAVDRIAAMVDQALAAGAHITHRAPLDVRGGHFFAPMVIAGVGVDSPLAREEIFGPVVPVVTWTEVDDLIRQLNASEYGLASYVHARDIGAGLRIAERLETGMVGVNRGMVSEPSAPFGGTKQSGIGREGARIGLEEFYETQYFSVAW